MTDPIEDLMISCRTTCGCGNPLVKYKGQIDNNNYLLTCSPYSERYEHPLLIAINKNSLVFEKARKWDLLNENKLFVGKAFMDIIDQSIDGQRLRNELTKIRGKWHRMEITDRDFIEEIIAELQRNPKYER